MHITGVFPQSKTQICVVHQIETPPQIRGLEGQKAFTHDMKQIYNAPTKEAAAAALKFCDGGKANILCHQKLARKLGRPHCIFEFPLEIRKSIYTTNIIENLNGKDSQVHQKQTFVSF